MLNTNQNDQLNIEISDTTVSVFPAVVHMGDIVEKFSGSQKNFSNMVSFAGDSSSYQNSLLFLRQIGTSIDMTSSVSSTYAEIRELPIPTFSDSSNPRPLGLFTFWSPDGTEAQLVSFSKIV